MPRGRTRRSLESLETCRFDLTVWQLCDLAARSGYPLKPRTLLRWIDIGYVAGHHRWDGDREWRISPAAARALFERLTRPAA